MSHEESMASKADRTDKLNIQLRSMPLLPAQRLHEVCMRWIQWNSEDEKQQLVLRKMGAHQQMERKGSNFVLEVWL